MVESGRTVTPYRLIALGLQWNFNNYKRILQIIYHMNQGYVDNDFGDTFTSGRRNNSHRLEMSSSSGFGNSLSVPGSLPGMMGSPPTEQPPGRRRSDGRGGYF